MLRLPGRDKELSVYAKEAYYAGPGSRVRRFAYRLDGFAALHAVGVRFVVKDADVFSFRFE